MTTKPVVIEEEPTDAIGYKVGDEWTMSVAKWDTWENGAEGNSQEWTFIESAAV